MLCSYYTAPHALLCLIALVPGNSLQAGLHMMRNRAVAASCPNFVYIFCLSGVHASLLSIGTPRGGRRAPPRRLAAQITSFAWSQTQCTDQREGSLTL